MKFLVLPVLLFLVACGSGGPDASALANNQGEGSRDGAKPSAEKIFADCFQRDATRSARLLEVLQGFFGDGAGAVPLPTIDLRSGLLSGGRIPYTWDLDENGANEITGALRFIDRSGATTIPFRIGDLVGLDLEDPATLLAAVPEGSRLELTYELGDTLVSGANDATGEGSLVFTFGAETINGIAGTGSFSAGECLFEFDFDNIDIDGGLLGGFPAVDFDFTAGVGEDTLIGTISLDGTGLLGGSGSATVSASLNGGEPEEFTFDLPELPDLGGLGDRR